MPEKVTLRLEQFDTAQDGDLLVTGPINLFATVEIVDELYELENVTDGVVAYVKNVTNDNASLKSRGAYFSYKELTDSWQEVLLGTHTHENKQFLDKLGDVDITGPVGTKKFFTLEIKDTDNSDATYEYDINWEDFPDIKGLPETIEGERDLYLGYDESGNPEWKNNFIAAQAFQFKSKQVTENSISVSFNDVFFDSALDEVLVLAGKFFVYNIQKPVQYNSQTKVLTVTLISDENSENEVESFEAGETISILVIRNGAAAILDSLAKDYVTYDDAINMLSGGTVNLNDYARKTDLNGYAKKYHTHSQFAREDHNHDYRYAMFNHTHSQYLTRKAALTLIEEVLAVNPDILDKLQAISDYLVENSPELSTLATKTDIEELQAQIDLINSSFATRVQDYLDTEATIQSERIKTNFTDQGGNAKNLDQMLVEILDEIGTDLGNTHADEVFLKENIAVILPQGQTIGDYGNLNRNTVDSQNNLQQILTNVFQKRVIPTYQVGRLETNFVLPELYEVGETINVTVNSSYIRNNSGLLSNYTIDSTVNDVTAILHQSPSLVSSVTKQILAISTPTILSVKGFYNNGEPLFDNIDTFYERFDPENEVPGKILAGDTNFTYLTVLGKRALFFGHRTSIPNILTSSIIRAGGKFIPESYDEFQVRFEVNSGSRFIYIAIPLTEHSDLSKILYAEQGNTDITEMFDTTEVSVEGFGGYTAVPYKVYKYELPFEIKDKMTLIFVK
jgi:hypothetical protein